MNRLKNIRGEDAALSVVRPSTFKNFLPPMPFSICIGLKLKECFGSLSYILAVCFIISGQKPFLNLTVTIKETIQTTFTGKDFQRQKADHKNLKIMEGYILFAGILKGIIQMLCLSYQGKINISGYHYLYISFCQVMSEASIMKYLGRNLFRFMTEQEQLTISKIITSRQLPMENTEIGSFAVSVEVQNIQRRK